MKKMLVLIAIAVFAQLLAAQAFAQAPSIKSLDPFHFGLGGLSGWQIGAGNPATGDSQNWGLYLQKSVPTATLTAAGADVVFNNVPAVNTLTVLSFDISGLSGVPFEDGGHGYCNNGAPRWNLTTSGGGTCFLGCAHGAKTQNPTSGWFTIKFTPPFNLYPGCGTPSGTITGLSIVMDEGTDVGPGNVVIDEITINSRIFKKP